MATPPPPRHFPTAAEIGDVPSPPPGMALSCFPPAQEHGDDPYWWEVAGRDIIRQRHIFDQYEGEEQKDLLREVLKEFPKKGRRMLDRAAKEGYPGAIFNLLELGVGPFGKFNDEEGKAVEGNGTESEDGDKSEHTDEEDDKMEEYKNEGEDEDGNVEFWPLHNAAFAGQLECVKVLVEKGNMDIEMKDDIGTTPLLNALLKKGADSEFKKHDDDGGVSVWQAAARSGKPDVLRLVLDSRESKEHPVDLDHRLLEFGAESGKVDMLRFILEKTGYPLNDEETESKSWKGASLTEEQKDVVEEALCGVVAHGCLEPLQLLLSYLAQHNPDGSFQYYKVKDEGREMSLFNGIEDAIKHADVFEVVWDTLLTPPPSVLDFDPEAKAKHKELLHRRLISASGEGALDTAKLILGKYKGNPNHISIKYHTTPLFIASAQGHVDLVRYLLDTHHVDIHIGCGQYANGPTALHNAILNRHDKIVRILLEHGGPVESLTPIAPPVKGKKLLATAYKKFRAPVKLLEERAFQRVKEEIKDYSNSVVVEVDRNDIEWIGKLLLRPRDERLKDDGRELMTVNDAEPQTEEIQEDGERPTKRTRRIPWLERMGLGRV